jgi:plasmid replication initiation protein
MLGMSKKNSKTTDAIERYAKVSDAIVEAGEISDWRFANGSSLSLRGAKTLHLLIQAAGIRITEDIEHRISYAELNKTYHLTLQQLEDVVDEMHTTILKLKLTHEDGRSYTKSGVIIADAERDNDGTAKAELRYRFSETMRKAISDSSHWAVISRKAVLAFNSKFSLRIYSLISLRANLRKTSEVFLLEDLRDIMGVGSTHYKEWANFRQRCLDSAIAELNQLAGFNVGYRALKTGRSVKAVELFWGIKGQDERIEALKELERSSVGRKARREGSVELIAQAEQIERHEIAELLSRLSER